MGTRIPFPVRPLHLLQVCSTIPPISTPLSIIFSEILLLCEEGSGGVGWFSMDVLPHLSIFSTVLAFCLFFSFLI